MQYSLRARVFDRIARILFFVCAILLIVVIVAVIGFIGSKAFSVFFEPHGANVLSFFFTDKWDPTGADDPSGNAIASFGAGGLLLGQVFRMRQAPAQALNEQCDGEENTAQYADLQVILADAGVRQAEEKGQIDQQQAGQRRQQ